MWTGLGVIFLIVLLAIPIIRTITLFIFGAGTAASGRVQTLQKLHKINEEKRKQEQLNTIQTMSPTFRHNKLCEIPDSVVVGERYETKQEYKDGYGWIFPCTITKKYRYYKSDATPYNYNIPKTSENGYTESLYEFIEKIDFVDEYEKREWKKKNNVHWTDGYTLVHECQCIAYCEAISMLAHRYINFGNNTEFKDEFIKLLIENRELTLGFIKDCHAANRWRETYDQIYDCQNYMKDFIHENDIAGKLADQAGHEIIIPSDLRPYCEDSTDCEIARHLKHEHKKRELTGQAEENEYKAQGWWGGTAIMTIVCVVLLLIFIFGTDHTDADVSKFFIGLMIVAGIIWLIVAFPAIGYQNDADKVKKTEQDDQYYVNWFPEEANTKGKEYAKKVLEDILKHPAPYKYYTHQK